MRESTEPWVVHVHLSPRLKQGVMAEVVRRQGTPEAIFVSEIIGQALELWLQKQATVREAEPEPEMTGTTWAEQFISSRCVCGGDGQVTNKDLYSAYLDWAREQHIRPWVSKITFGRVLRAQGLTSDNGQGNVLYWAHLALRPVRRKAVVHE